MSPRMNGSKYPVHVPRADPTAPVGDADASGSVSVLDGHVDLRADPREAIGIANEVRDRSTDCFGDAEHEEVIRPMDLHPRLAGLANDRSDGAPHETDDVGPATSRHAAGDRPPEQQFDRRSEFVQLSVGPSKEIKVRVLCRSFEDLLDRDRRGEQGSAKLVGYAHECRIEARAAVRRAGQFR